MHQRQQKAHQLYKILHFYNKNAKNTILLSDLLV
jgi:hypothetical protein